MMSSTTPSERSIGFLGFMVMLAKNPFNHVLRRMCIMIVIVDFYLHLNLVQINKNITTN